MIPSFPFADFDYSFILFGAWIQYAVAAAAMAAQAFGANKQAKQTRDNAREQRAWQEQMSNTAHTREIRDLRNAGLNPILSAKNSGAPTGAGAMAQAPDYSKAYGSGVANALMIAQTRKTNAEATLVEDQSNKAGLESDFYGSVAGAPAIAAKSLGGAGTAYGTYRAARALKKMYKRKKSKPAISRPKKSKFKAVKRSKHTYVIDKRTGESKRVFRRKSRGGGGVVPFGRGSFRNKVYRRF